eukprot:12530817-Alexandrium_andersonii.AAC.1
MHLASYSLAALARTRDPAVWPGVLAQLLWAGVAAPEGGGWQRPRNWQWSSARTAAAPKPFRGSSRTWPAWA